MAYRIDASDDLFEIHVWGETSKWEVLEAVGRMWEIDPRKKRCDLWIFAPESVIPVAAFADIAAMVRRLCMSQTAGSRSALVATDELQRAEFEMYRAEAADMPFEIRVFSNRGDALEWLRG